jgi:hypothetical protein
MEMTGGTGRRPPVALGAKAAPLRNDKVCGIAFPPSLPSVGLVSKMLTFFVKLSAQAMNIFFAFPRPLVSWHLRGDAFPGPRPVEMGV